MLRILLPDGRRRRLTVREGARLQSFPDWFVITGREQSQFDQIGNAVPPLLAKAVARSVLACLQADQAITYEGNRRSTQLRLWEAAGEGLARVATTG